MDDLRDDDGLQRETRREGDPRETDADRSVGDGIEAFPRVETRTLLDPGGARSEQVDWHLACSVCGYDLFELARTGVCPECGTQVSMSLRGWLLRDLGVRAARAYARSAMLAAIATFFVPLLAILQMMVDGARASKGVSGGMFVALGVGEAVLGLAMLAAIMCWLRGWWGLTRSEDHAAWRGDGSRVLSVRLAGVVTRACSWLVVVGLGMLYAGRWVGRSRAVESAGFILTLGALAGLLIAGPVVVRMLARGLPVTRVASGAKVLHVFGIVLVVTNSICAFTMFAPIMVSMDFVGGLVYFSVLLACLVDFSALAGNEAHLAAARADAKHAGEVRPAEDA